MNFLVAALFAATDDEVITFALMSKLMLEQQWRAVYSDDLLEVVKIGKKVEKWLELQHPKVAGLLNEAGTVLSV
jgi:hydroxymethylpyrimidine/phosphomethylpyrimidine kinase